MKHSPYRCTIELRRGLSHHTQGGDLRVSGTKQGHRLPLDGGGLAEGETGRNGSVSRPWLLLQLCPSRMEPDRQAYKQTVNAV